MSSTTSRSSGVRSGVYKLTVRNLPAVRTIDLELRYPAYTGLQVERIEDGGDIAAVRGTRVSVSVRSTMPVRGGRLVFEGDSAVAMKRGDDSTLVGELVVRQDGFYRVELTAEDGTKVAGSVEYVVDALDDMPPTIAIRKPGRDVRPTNVEEVFVEVEATDDFGVGRVELVYSVNGQAEKTLVLNDSVRHALRRTSSPATRSSSKNWDCRPATWFRITRAPGMAAALAKDRRRRPTSTS